MVAWSRLARPFILLLLISGGYNASCLYNLNLSWHLSTYEIGGIQTEDRGA